MLPPFFKKEYKFYGKIASQYGGVEIASPVFERAAEFSFLNDVLENEDEFKSEECGWHPYE